MTFRDKQEPNCTRRQNKTRLDGDSELFELPRRSSRLNGHVECDNGAGRYESRASRELPGVPTEAVA